MNMQTTISLSQVCDYFHIDLELVRDFADFGLYPTVLFDDEIAIEAQSLDRLKRVISLNQSLGINKEGIEIVLDLRERISTLQDEVDLLQNEVSKLKRYLGGDESEAPTED